MRIKRVVKVRGYRKSNASPSMDQSSDLVTKPDDEGDETCSQFGH